MVRRFSFLLVTGFMLLVLASCATVKPQITTKQEPAGWQADKQQRQKIKNWEIRGRLGVQTETEGGTLDIIWKQSGQDFTIHLIAPFGAGNYLVHSDNGLTEIRYPDGQVQMLNDVDDVFSNTLQVNLPVSAVKDWIRGLPAKSLSLESIRWNEQGQLSVIEQSGWNIEMKKYAGKKISLPHAVYLSRDDNEDLDVRLVLRQWLID